MEDSQRPGTCELNSYSFGCFEWDAPNITSCICHDSSVDATMCLGNLHV